MKWTKEPPIKPGWYWWRLIDVTKGKVVYVRGFGGLLIVERESALIELRTYGGEWWPEKIEPPENE